MGCKNKKKLFMSFKRFLDGSNLGSTVYNVGEKPTVILYRYVLIAMQGHQKKINK